MDKVHKHCDALSAKVSKKQGGANRGQGPKSASKLKASGDAVTHPTPFTKQDQSREQGGMPKNPYHEV